MMERRNQVFQTLKPHCVKLSQAALGLAGKAGNSKDVVDSLARLLTTLKDITTSSGSLDEKLADYVFFPLSHVLRESQNLPVRALELSLHSLSILLRTGWRSRIAPNLGGQLLILLTFLANASSAGKKIPNTSEELQSVAFICLSELFSALAFTQQGRESLISSANIPALSHAITVVLEGITNGASNEVQLAALAALKAVCSAMEERDALASFLPGIVSSLTRVLTPSTKSRRSFRLLEGGLDVLSKLFHIVLSDAHTKDLPDNTEDDGKSPKFEGLTLSWLKATAGQIKLALANIVKLRQHDRIEVRQALLRLCIRVLKDCRVSLSQSTSMMVETLVMLSGVDERDEVQLTLKQMLGADSNLANLLRSSLHGWVTALPRIMQSPDDSAKRKFIHLVSIAFRILSEQGIDLTIVDRVMASNLRDSVSNVICESKGFGSVIESSSTSSLTDKKTWSVENQSTSFQPLLMNSKGQEDTVLKLESLLEQLAASDSSMMISRDLIEFTRSSSREPQLASFWLSLKLLELNTKHSIEIEDFLDLGTSQVGLRTELLEELYSFSLHILTNSDSETELDWRFHALSLETVAMQAMRNRVGFRAELVDALYPVIHLVGSSNPMLRNHAITCLNIVSDACGYAHAGDLIVSNVDYLVNAVALKLNTFDISPQAPQVLLMMIRLSGPSLLPYLDDLVESIFAALEYFHGYPKLVELLFSVLKGIAEEGVKTPQLAITTGDIDSHHKPPWKLASVIDVVDVIKAMKIDAAKSEEEKAEKMEGIFLQKPWNPASNEEEHQANDSLDEEIREEQPAERPETPPRAPKIFDILLKISQLTQHYLTSLSPSLRMSLLSLLNTTFPALASHENSFLPLINTLWPVLLPRLEDPEAYVVSGALDVVAIMCLHAGDFMTSRIEGIWEDITKIHHRAARAVRKPPQSSGDSTSMTILQSTPRRTDIVLSEPAQATQAANQEYYVDAPTRLVWESLVRFLTTIVENVSVREEIFDDVLSMLEPVLEERTAIKKSLEIRNSDAVWLKLFAKSQRQMHESEVKNGPKYKLTEPVGRPEWKFARLEAR